MSWIHLGPFCTTLSERISCQLSHYAQFLDFTQRQVSTELTEAVLNSDINTWYHRHPFRLFFLVKLLN